MLYGKIEYLEMLRSTGRLPKLKEGFEFYIGNDGSVDIKGIDGNVFDCVYYVVVYNNFKDVILKKVKNNPCEYNKAVEMDKDGFIIFDKGSE